MSSSSSSSSPVVPLSPLVTALCGGLSGCAASLVSHPLELLKVRYQLHGEFQSSHRGPPLLESIRSIASSDGLLGFYRGLTASLYRQIVYSTARFAVYDYLKRSATSDPIIASPPAALNLVFYSALSGVFGGILSSPLDLILIRFQSDQRLPPHERRNYRSPLHAALEIARTDGVLGLWRGCGANVQRALVVTVAQFATYDMAKRSLNSLIGIEGLALQLSSSILTGLVVATVASPVDVLRTRLMNRSQRAAELGSAPRAAAAIFKAEGIAGFFKGLIPYYARVGPHVTAMFIAFEQLQILARRLTTSSPPADHEIHC